MRSQIFTKYDTEATSSFNWALLPNVPSDKRTAIENACTAAASGQSFTANDVFSTLATAAYWWSFEIGSVFTSTDTSTPATANGQTIGCARDWISNALATQPTSTQRGVLSSGGITFDGTDDRLTISTAITNNSNFSTFLVIRPVALPFVGFFITVGNSGSNGWGLGLGGSAINNSGSTVQGLLGGVAYVGSTTTVVAQKKTYEWHQSAQNSATLIYNGSTATTNGTSMAALSATTSIGNNTAGRTNLSSPHETSGVISFTSALSTTSQLQIRRFLNSYYSVA